MLFNNGIAYQAEQIYLTCDVVKRRVEYVFFQKLDDHVQVLFLFLASNRFDHAGKIDILKSCLYNSKVEFVSASQNTLVSDFKD